MDAGGEMTLFDKFSQSNGDPFSFFADKDLSIFGMFTPSSPFSLNLGLTVVEENSGGSCTHGIVIRFIAHHNNVVFRFQPCDFLDEVSFDDMLLFFWSSGLFSEIFDCGQFIESHLMAKTDSQIFIILTELEGFHVLTSLSSVALDLNFFLNSPDDEIFPVLSQISIGGDHESFIIGELGINRSGLSEQSFVFEAVSDIEVNTLICADCQIAAARRENHFIDLMTQRQIF